MNDPREHVPEDLQQDLDELADDLVVNAEHPEPVHREEQFEQAIGVTDDELPLEVDDHDRGG